MIKIYDANIADADNIAKLFVNNVDVNYITASEEIWSRATVEKGWNENLYENIRCEIIESLKNGDKIILVMLHDEKLIGYTLTAIKPNNCAELEDFVMDKEYRKKGLGKKLYEKTIESCQKNNINTLFLEVGINNKKMHKFCQSNDLKITSVRYYKKLTNESKNE